MIPLVPFPGLSATAGVRCAASRDGTRLRLRWQLDDPAGAVVLDAPAAPERRDGLWQRTCFEAFLMGEGPGYWELNLSPAGHWNVYRFDGYRAGMREEAAVTALPFEAAGGAVTLELDLADLLPGPWRLGLAAVLLDAHGRESFLALAHAGSEPDFHLAEGFTLRL